MEKIVIAGKNLIACSKGFYMLISTQIISGIAFFLIDLTNKIQLEFYIASIVTINLFVGFFVAEKLKAAGLALSKINNKNDI
jgi:hypothetical protein